MVRSVLPLLLGAALVCPLTGQGLEFEGASIRRNTSDRPTPTAGPPPTAASGQLTLNWIPARFLATRAYPDLTTPVIVEGLPGWAETERYDVTVKFPPGATASDQAAMWRTLLAERMKLQAHYETRARAGYRLVMARADRRLGPDLKPATIDCPPPGAAPPSSPPTAVRDIAMQVLRERRAPTAQEEATLTSSCLSMGIGDRFYAGAADIRSLMQSLSVLGRLEGPIVDATGLEGRYSFKLWAARAAVAPQAAASAAAPEPTLNDAPSIFEALRDQLGLKLEKTTIDGTILVVDHIERPTEN
jgi:uncharacterized protein (TIGR03435 family)